MTGFLAILLVIEGQGQQMRRLHAGTAAMRRCTSYNPVLEYESMRTTVDAGKFNARLIELAQIDADAAVLRGVTRAQGRLTWLYNQLPTDSSFSFSAPRLDRVFDRFAFRHQRLLTLAVGDLSARHANRLHLDQLSSFHSKVDAAFSLRSTLRNFAGSYELARNETGSEHDAERVRMSNSLLLLQINSVIREMAKVVQDLLAQRCPMSLFSSEFLADIQNAPPFTPNTSFNLSLSAIEQWSHCTASRGKNQTLDLIFHFPAIGSKEVLVCRQESFALRVVDHFFAVPKISGQVGLYRDNYFDVTPLTRAQGLVEMPKRFVRAGSCDEILFEGNAKIPLACLGTVWSAVDPRAIALSAWQYVLLTPAFITAQLSCPGLPILPIIIDGVQVFKLMNGCSLTAPGLFLNDEQVHANTSLDSLEFSRNASSLLSPYLEDLALRWVRSVAGNDPTKNAWKNLTTMQDVISSVRNQAIQSNFNIVYIYSVVVTVIITVLFGASWWLCAQRLRNSARAAKSFMIANIGEGTAKLQADLERTASRLAKAPSMESTVFH